MELVIKVIVLILLLICFVVLVGYAVQIGKANKLGKASENYAIKGWVARDKTGDLWFYSEKPYRRFTQWSYDGHHGRQYCMHLSSTLFPDLRWEDEPIEVEVWFIRK